VSSRIGEIRFGKKKSKGLEKRDRSDSRKRGQPGGNGFAPHEKFKRKRGEGARGKGGGKSHCDVGAGST